MSLSDNPVRPAIAVSDMERATAFYEGVLGLTGGTDQPDGGRSYPCGGGTSIHVYPSAHAGGSGATAAAWEVADVEATVDELAGRGLSCERYGEPFNTDEKGIARLGDSAIAWFKDPDGNVLAIGSE